MLEETKIISPPVRPLRLEEFKVVVKPSKFECDALRTGLSEKELLRSYDDAGVDSGKIFESHLRQSRAKELIERIFGSQNLIRRIERDVLSLDAPVVISLGGDNHFTAVSHAIEDNLLLGVNSDPERSSGALNSCSIDEFEEALICLTKGDYRIERWTRIGIQTRDRMLRATSEIFIGEYAREMMSRHILALSGGEREEQKCSGILVASGAGSTGWYDSAIRYLVPDGAPYSSQSTELRYLVTEPYRGKFSGLRFLNGEVSPGQPLELTILSDSQPVIALDSFKRFPLARGERLRIAPSRVPLNVLQVGE